MNNLRHLPLCPPPVWPGTGHVTERLTLWPVGAPGTRLTVLLTCRPGSPEIELGFLSAVSAVTFEYRFSRAVLAAVLTGDLAEATGDDEVQIGPTCSDTNVLVMRLWMGDDGTGAGDWFPLHVARDRMQMIAARLLTATALTGSTAEVIPLSRRNSR